MSLLSFWAEHTALTYIFSVYFCETALIKSYVELADVIIKLNLFKTLSCLYLALFYFTNSSAEVRYYILNWQADFVELSFFVFWMMQ